MAQGLCGGVHAPLAPPWLCHCIWNYLASSLSCKIHQTTSYHPQSNGFVERFHHSLKSSLHTHLSGRVWFIDLPWILLSLHTMPKPDLGFSPARCTLGQQSLLLGGLIVLRSTPDLAIFLIYHCITTCLLFLNLIQNSMMCLMCLS